MKAIIRDTLVCLTFTGLHTATGHPLQQTPDSKKKQAPISISPVTGIPADSTLHFDTMVPFIRDTSFNRIDTRMKAAAVRLKQKIVLAKAFLQENNFNTEICFMVDMSIPSGKKRFFVYNIKKDTVEFSSMVSHGYGSWRTDCDDKLVFSNMANSKATSLGKYRIGTSYYGTYGLSYRLYGLDSSNSNAIPRAIVLHSDRYVPETEPYPRHIFESAGCPTVSESFLVVLTKYMKKSRKPMLLWIYN